MHECPECGLACYCNGDIDDCQFEEIPRQGCWHYMRCDADENVILDCEEEEPR